MQLEEEHWGVSRNPNEAVFCVFWCGLERSLCCLNEHVMLHKVSQGWGRGLAVRDSSPEVAVSSGRHHTSHHGGDVNANKRTSNSLRGLTAIRRGTPAPEYLNQRVSTRTHHEVIKPQLINSTKTTKHSHKNKLLPTFYCIKNGQHLLYKYLYFKIN